MRNISLAPSWHRPQWIILSLAIIAYLILFDQSARAQQQYACGDGSNPDALGCANDQTDSNQRTPPLALSIPDHPQDQVPSADNSNEASANNSLQTGASYSENTARKPSRKVEVRIVPPEPPTEFQNFVAASTGRMLPIFGAKLFSAQSASFAPTDRGPAPAELIVGPEDELRIRVWGQVNFSANLRVSRGGDIYLPKVGAVHVAGLPFSFISSHLRNAMERVYRNFDLNVDMGEIHTLQIYVAGMARQPGEYTVSALSTMVDVLFASGGPGAAGSMRHIQLKRDGKVITDFDLYALLVNGDKSGDMQLQPHDVLYIPACGPQVALVGSVRLPGIYELRGRDSIEQIFEAAGGMTAIANGAHLSIDRIEMHTVRRTFSVATDPAALSTPLTDGDILTIEPIVSDFRDAVTLRGAVASPGRFKWHQGMRLSELMPEPDVLLKRDYWWNRTRLGLPAPLFALATDEGPLDQSTGKETSLPQSPAVQTPASQTNWNQAVIERVDPSNMSTRLIPFALGKLVFDHDSAQDLELEPGDVVTIYAQQQIQLPIKEQTIYVELAGEFVHPGVYSVSPGETLRSVVTRAGGLTERAYLYASTFTRVSTKTSEQQELNEYADRLERQASRNSGAQTNAPQGQPNSANGDQLTELNRELISRVRTVRASGRIVLQLHPESQGMNALPDMHLEDGDQLIVPFTPETIQVIGAVFNPHAFLFSPNTRVGELLRLAGGPNRDADKGRMFVLRADGSVIGRGQAAGLLGSDLMKLRLYPGDAIVMPEREFRPSALNQLAIWSQFLSQLSLNALEVNAIK